MGVRAEGDTIKASGVVGAWSVRPPVQTLGGVGFWALGLRNMLGRLVMSLLFLACVVLPSYQALVRLHCPEGQGCHPSPLTLVVTPPLMGATILAGFVGTLIFLSRLFRAALKLSAAEVRLPLSSLCFLMYSELLVFSVLGRDYFLNPFLSGTCFMRWLYRALGARLGRRVHLSDPPLMDCHMLTIGDDAILDNTECQGHVLVGGVLSTSPTSVGRGCVLQPGSAVFGGDRVEDGAWVGPRTKAMPGQVFSSGEHWHGVPACAVRVRTAPVQ
ncbi:unnamed protein product [Ostreobium quekettii]|uniref:Uncharacterized protein n=1 Tax=Ostreobium quekettii TaxID=121088 RepID=A0A8S1J900_9CHLO|nr:unnamed protein product [Ostreobium quekettii]